MTKADDVPEWAREKACKLTNEEAGYPYLSSHLALEPPGRAFARYIAAHEPAPVDPLLYEARAVVVDCLSEGEEHETDKVLAGEWDKGFRIAIALAGLRRGVDLGARGVTHTNAGTEPEGE